MRLPALCAPLFAVEWDVEELIVPTLFTEVFRGAVIGYLHFLDIRQLAGVDDIAVIVPDLEYFHTYHSAFWFPHFNISLFETSPGYPMKVSFCDSVSR